LGCIHCGQFQRLIIELFWWKNNKIEQSPGLDSSIKAILRPAAPQMLRKAAMLGMGSKQELTSFLCLLPISPIPIMWVMENSPKEEASSVLSVVNPVINLRIVERQWEPQ
jgi:hypothetical protein